MRFAPILFFALISCEGGTTYTKSIQNDSSETLNVTTFSYYLGQQGFDGIQSGETREVYFIDLERQFSGPNYNCTEDVDSISVLTNSGKTLVQNILSREDWTRESMGGRMSREDCVITLTDSDFE